jgi:Tol biopolymer transport system component
MMRSVISTVLFFVAFSVSGALGLAAQVPPNEDWRTLETTHFRVTYPADLESVARRAGEFAERAHEALSDRFVDPPEGPIELLVTDHDDQSNGFANALPFNRITVFVRPPTEGYNATHFDDWLELVITHELVHVFHLDRTGPLGNAVRSVLGRSSADWPAFPGYDLPAWIGEGMATYYESVLTGAGRVNGTFHDMVLRTAVLEDQFEGPGQVSGLSPNWPAGIRAYAYGTSFLDYMLTEYGEERLGDFVNGVSRQLIPWRVESVAKDAFGIEFGEAWSSWQTELEATYRARAVALAEVAPLTTGEPITTAGRFTLFPKVSPDGTRLAYFRSDGRSDLQLRSSNLDGSEGRKVTRLNGVLNWAWLPDGDVLAAEREHTDLYRIRSDLVRIDPDGDERWITRGARLAQPTTAPDGRFAVAVQDGDGTNRLVRVDLTTGVIEPLTDFVATEHWGYPAWSPDGKWLAASRLRPDAFYDLLVLDTDGDFVQQVTLDRAIDQAATWSPDGRWLLWSSDRSGIPNLYAVSIDPQSGEPGPIRQITNMLGGSAYPSVDPSGMWIYFSSYQAHGWDVERIRFDPGTWFDPLPMQARFSERGEPAERLGPESTDQPSALSGADSKPYSVMQTIWPRAWEPIFRSGVSRQGRRVLRRGFGARVDGQDLVGRHAYGLEGVVRGSGRTEVGGSYTYLGKGNPLFGFSFRQDHDIAGPFDVETDQGDSVRVFVGERERALRGRATFVRQRMRSRASVSFSTAHIWERLEVLDENLEESPLVHRSPRSRLGEASATLSYSNTRSHPFSTTAETGFGGFLRVLARHELSLPGSERGISGMDRGFRDVIGRVRGYHAFSGPGFSRHVFAWRGSFGGAFGPGADRFHFDVGGAPGRVENLTGFELFGGRPLLFPVRGYDAGHRSGRYAWTASAEYRFPIANVHGAWGFFPLHIDRVSGSLFIDGGNAWGDSFEAEILNPRGSTLGSVGAELQVSMLALFNTRLFVRIGAVAALNGGDATPFYLRLGTAF